MVSTRGSSHHRWHGSQGKLKLGCILGLVVLAVVVVYGIGIGGHIFKYYQLKDEMNTQARLASTNDDETIRRRVLNRIDQLNLPSQARNLTIRRTLRPPQILIRTSYEVVFRLPFYDYPYRFRPEIRAPL